MGGSNASSPAGGDNYHNHDDECPTTPSKSTKMQTILCGKRFAPSSGNSNTNSNTGSSSSSVGSHGTSGSGNSNNGNPAKDDRNHIGAIISSKLDVLPPNVQFCLLALSVFAFFGVHNVLQESMISTSGFSFGVMLGWMEVLGVTLCSSIERSSFPFLGNGEGRRPRRAPLVAYPPLTICLLLSSSLASWSLNYINFPTKVVFRSCKLLPTMVLAVAMGNAAAFTPIEIASAAAVCFGLVTFASGDWFLSAPQFHPFGLTLVSASVCADAVLPNAQEKLFRNYDASKSEVMFFTNVFTLMAQTVSAIVSGDMVGMARFVMGMDGADGDRIADGNEGVIQMDGAGVNGTRADSILHPPSTRHLLEELPDDHGPTSYHQVRTNFLICAIAYIFISHIAVSAHTAVVKKFGGVAAVFVGTARKGMTLLLSFMLFPKESNWRYGAGAALVLGGLLVAGLEKMRNKHKRDKKKVTAVANSALMVAEGGGGVAAAGRGGAGEDKASHKLFPYKSKRSDGGQHSTNNNVDDEINPLLIPPLLDMEDVELAGKATSVGGAERRRGAA